MENQLQIFNNPEFGTIRTLGNWENPLFCLADACKILDLRVDGVVARLKGDPITAGVLCKNPVQTAGGIQQMYFVNEDGLYDVILDSRKPEARRFRKWITCEVLPSIRKYGYYIAPNIENAINNIAQDLATNSNELACLTAQTPVLSLQIKAMMEKILADYKKAPNKTVALIEDLPGEIWKWFKGYEGIYQGSNKGRVRSFFRGKCRLLKPTPSHRGYLGICLYTYDEKTKKQRKKTFRLNRLIAETFIPNPENKPEVHHKDNDKTNNAADNLEWVTGEENRQHAHEDGRYLRGEKNPCAKLTEDDVRFIRRYYKSGDPQFGNIALAERFKVSDVTITNIVTFKSWKNVQLLQENLLTDATEISLFD